MKNKMRLPLTSLVFLIGFFIWNGMGKTIGSDRTIDFFQKHRTWPAKETLLLDKDNVQQKKHIRNVDSSGNGLDFRLKNVQKITPVGGYTSPIWSAGKQNLLAFVGDNGTFIFSLTAQRMRKLTDETAGFNFSWTSDETAIFYRALVDRQEMVVKYIEVGTGNVTTLSQSNDLGIPQEVRPGVIQYRDGQLYNTRAISGPIPNYFEKPFVYQFNDQIFVVVAGLTKQITKGDGKYFMPRLSPDGSKILYYEISQGLYIADIQGNVITHLDRGDDAMWSPDNKYVIFEIAIDNGHTISSSEIYIADLSGHKKQLTNTPELVEMRPSWSPDGRFISFDANGAIYIAEIAQGG